MTLTTDDMSKIIVDFLLNKTPRVIGLEADEFRTGLEGDLAYCEKNELVLDIPGEFPDVSNN